MDGCDVWLAWPGWLAGWLAGAALIAGMAAADLAMAKALSNCAPQLVDSAMRWVHSLKKYQHGQTFTSFQFF